MYNAVTNGLKENRRYIWYGVWSIWRRLLFVATSLLVAITSQSVILVKIHSCHFHPVQCRVTYNIYQLPAASWRYCAYMFIRIMLAYNFSLSWRVCFPVNASVSIVKFRPISCSVHKSKICQMYCMTISMFTLHLLHIQ